MEKSNTNSNLRVFISYGHDEYSDFAINLAEELEKENFDVFIDKDGIRTGEDWEINLEDGLNWTAGEESDGLFLLLMTPYSVRRPDGYCLNELAYAIDLNLRIIPVMLKRVTPPLSIYRIQYCDLPTEANKDSDGIHRSISRIIGLLKEPCSLDYSGDFKSLERKLDPIDFNSEIKLYTKNFVGRDWLKQKLIEWLGTKENILLITGMPGIGKSAISTFLYQKMPNVIGFYMFRKDDNDKLYFRKFVTTVAFQISSQIPEYREKLLSLNIEQLLSMHEGATLFQKMIAMPLSELKCIEEKQIILIDGLDEAERDHKNIIAYTLAKLEDELPDWIKIIILSRPVSSVIAHLHSASKIEIKSDSNENQTDLSAYIINRLGDQQLETINKIIDRSEGSFLYAKYVCDKFSPQIMSDLPSGMSNFYYSSFGELFKTNEEYDNKARRFFEWILPSTRPISTKMLAVCTGCNSYEVNAFINMMRPFLRIANNSVSVYHTSLSEWLSDNEKAQDYWIDLKECSKKESHFINELLKENIGSFDSLDDYKNKRGLLGENIGMDVDRQLIHLYLDLIEFLEDWESFVIFSIWYIGSVPSFSYEILGRISEIQDKNVDKLDKNGRNQKLYEIWKKKMVEFIELSTEWNYTYQRPITNTGYIYILEKHCHFFLNTNLSSTTLEARCRVTSQAFQHMRYDFLHFESFHEDLLCSCFVDMLRKHFRAILLTGKIKDPDVIQWLEKVKQEDD